ncbi:NAD(P)/FAD-dependent oxidoreductase [Nonomuraea sp. NPDC000554]|uniref:flavin monoamine oxidase family protein n=1 Tax=Nonomuraea sp. NPDC000554 TaxID=3154259 RepID=UPI003325C4E7
MIATESMPILAYNRGEVLMPSGGVQHMQEIRAIARSLHPQPSRRDILRSCAILAGAGAFVAATPKIARATPHDAKVVIVGAGLAGLTCAYRLHRHGVRAQVFEAHDDRVGGRCWTARSFADGQLAEHGGEFVDTRHVHLRRLAAELGLRMDDRGKAGERGTGRLRLNGKPQDRAKVFKDLPQVIKRLAVDAKRIGDYRYNRASDAAREFDEMSALEWLKANVDDPLLLEALDVSQSGFFGLDTARMSAINLIETFVKPPGDADERYHVHGGNDQVPRRLADRLPDGSLHLGFPLHAVRQLGDGTYDLRFKDLHRTVRADVVVLCLPFTALREVDLTEAGLSERKRQAIDELGMGTNAKLLLQFRDRLSRHHNWSGSFSTDQPRSGGWDSTAYQPGSGSVLTIFNGGHAGASYPVERAHGRAPEEVVRRALRVLDRMVPGVSDAYNGRAWLDSWVDDPWVRGSYAGFLPGQYTKFWHSLHMAEGALHFGGEHTSTHSQGYLNGGVESGERCAKEVIAALGK